MPQGKLKQKTKVPNSVKAKKKGSAFTTRARAPIQPKKHKFAEQQKLKQIVSKSVNKSVEQEMRSRAKEGHLNLSKAQLAVAKHHKDKSDAVKTEESAME
ncbi:uncharacterized protein LOC119071615 [Bradysia coprophila]|uniref:uncharacterized protein LOC119071615 n=1 Tax=Bradysia coprophila TaxID=38358 RepID=UPI00187D8B25|nr:uncharacterized protein LOC119071615 [Bradysia coprophila]